MKFVCVLLALLSTPAFAVQQWNPQPGVGLILRADTTGANDVSAQLNADIGVSTNIIVPPGRYLLNGTATVALSHVTITCEGDPSNANDHYGTSGATFRMTSTSVQPFTVGSGVRIVGCNFYWPNQTGTTSTPTAYPPLFTEVSGSNLSNFDLVNDRIVNAYDVLGQTSCANSDGFGNVHFDHTYGYAIRYWLNVCNVPETMVIDGMVADWNLFQNNANAGPNYYLVKWTAANGAFLHVFGNGNGSTTASTDIVGGIIFNGSIFAYNKVVWVDNTGYLNESIFHGIFDAVPHDIEIDSGGCAAQLQMDGEYYSYQWNPPSGGFGGTDNAPAFSLVTPASGFSGCTLTDISIRGSLEEAQGDVLDASGAYDRVIGISLRGNGTYGNSSTASTYYFANINGGNIILDATGNHVEPASANSTHKGFNLADCFQCTVNANSFTGTYAPITVGTVGSIIAAGNDSLSTPAGGALSGSGQPFHTLFFANTWDANAVNSPTLTSCGTSPTLNTGSTDVSGSVAVGTGTVTACTINFAYSWTIGPTCIVDVGNGPSWNNVTTSSLTVTMQNSNPGGSLWYHCNP